MDFLSLLSSHEAAGFFITLAGQSILISITGLVLLKLLSKKTAPLRSLVCAATIIAMGLLIVIFIGARLSDISWQMEPTPVIEQETTSNFISVPYQYEPLPVASLPNVSSKPLQIEPVPHIVIQPYIPQNIDTAYMTPNLEHSPYSISLSSTVITIINMLGLIWIIGVLFQLFRLGYGLILVKKFKRSIEAIKDISFNNMLSNIAATLFRKGRLVPRLYRSSLIESPMAIGFIHPAIIIPEKLFTTLTDNELKSILLHEMAHIYHYDQV
ncbi:MAG: M56 family metallopeptidase, partial [Desulfatiglans sp.]|nr:M56 family metallopeptidase [Desulfatiglans sp.]